MQVTETKSEGLSREYKVALPAKEIEEKLSHRLKEMARTAQLPGFRPGKVPVSLLRKKYGPSVMGEILERAVNDSSQQAMAEKGLRPAMKPEIEITSFEDGGDLEYTIAIEILPDIKPSDFSTIKLERRVRDGGEAEIDKALAEIAATHGTSAPARKKRKTRTGDVVIIDFVGRVDGNEFAGGKAEGYELTLGSGSFIPGFEEQLIGVEAGDDISVKVKFPDSYGAAELSGKDVVFEVSMKELRETVPSAIDDELAKKLGMENLEALKNSIREEHDREFNNMSRLLLKRSLLDVLADTHDFEVPDKLLEREFETIWKQFEEQRKKAKQADALLEEDKTDDEHKKEFREIAERRIRLGLLMSEVGRSNNLQISQEDLNRQLMAEASRHPGHEKEVMEQYKNNPEAMESLSAPIYEDKVVDFILEQVSVTEKKTTMEELMKAMTEDPDDAKPKTKKAKSSAKTKSKAPSGPKAKSKTTKKPAPKAAKKDQ